MTLSSTDALRGDVMQAKGFPDTDTLPLQFNDREIAGTFDVGEDVLVEVDKEGCLVTMTIEHAKQQTNVNEFSYHMA